MTNTEMKEWFNILSDKYNRPWFNDSEMDHLLNDAQLDYVMEFVTPTDEGVFGKLERTIYNSMALSPLVKSVSATTNATGGITFTSINTLLGASQTFIVPLRVKPTTAGYTKAARKVREFELDSILDNSLSGTDIGWDTNFKGKIQPVYVLRNDLIQLEPRSLFNAKPVDVVVLKVPNPIAVASTPGELPAFTHRKIVAKAMASTGLITEHDALLLMEQKTNG